MHRPGGLGFLGFLGLSLVSNLRAAGG